MPKKKIAATTVDLDILPASMFPTPEALRAFVAGADYEDLAHIIEVVVDRAGRDDSERLVIDHDESAAAYYLVCDLRGIAKALAAESGVRNARGFYSKVIAPLCSLARIAARFDSGEDSVAALLAIIEHVAKHSAAEAA